MLMNLKITPLKNKLKKYLKDKDIIDIILFGSFVKGKQSPRDIDIAIITKKDVQINISGFHVSVLKPEDFFKSLSLINTLFREGYSLKNNKPFSELYKFSSRVLFVYELSGLKPSKKVGIVSLLHGKNDGLGMVEENSGEWLANQVFIVPVNKDYIFEKFFLNMKVKFKKSFLLIH